jgi:hypothetical protein
MGQSPVQGVLPKCINGFIVSEVNPASKQDSGAKPWHEQKHLGLPQICNYLYSSTGKVKGKVFPVLNWAPRHEGVLGEWRYSSTHSLTSALYGGEWSASRPGRFASMERAPGTHWIGGWVGPKAVLDAVVMRKIPSPLRESNLRTPIVQPVAQRYTDWDITAVRLCYAERGGDCYAKL